MSIGNAYIESLIEEMVEQEEETQRVSTYHKPRCRKLSCPGCAPPPAPKHNLTPSEIALARVLKAWDEWPGHLDPTNTDTKEGPIQVMAAIHDTLLDWGLVDGGTLMKEGQGLLDRARKAGVV